MRWLAARYAIVSLMARGRSRFNRAFIAYSLLAGVGQAVVLAIVNSAAARGNNDARHLVLFCVAVGVYLLTQSEVISIAGLEFERVLHQIRTSIAQHIARAELESLEHIGRSEIYAGVNRETVIISQASSAIAVACQSATMIVCSAVYLERLSTTAFVLTCVSALVGVRAFLAKRDDATRLITEANRSQNEFFESMMHLIDGFKEVRLHEPRARALINRLRDISGELKTTKSKSERAFAEQFVVSQAVMYLQIGAVVFVLPALGPTLPGVVIQATAAVLFLVGPLANLVVTAPVFQRANVAAKNVLDLEARLARAEPPETTTPDRVTTLDRNIVLRDVLFQYDGHGGEPGFALGPLDLAIRPGEILFLVGGNGSGKSTLLRLLTGLYYPQAGAIEIGTTASSASRAGWYRSHFSAVFSDYHLFDRPYGMEDVDPERIRKGLEQMQLDRKVHLQDNRFSTLDLSSGQRKRLALLVALLEDRPVLVCDEWAAEQDPDFRRTFYTELLPSLRANGKTIIAATHDDRYFDIADRIVKLRYGVIVADRGRNDPVA